MEPTRWFLMAKDGGSNFLDGFTRCGGEHELVDSMRQGLQKHKGYNWENANFDKNGTTFQQHLGWKLIAMMRTCMQMRVSPHMCLQNIFVPPPILRCKPLINFLQLWKFGFDDSGCLFFFIFFGIYIPEKKRTCCSWTSRRIFVLNHRVRRRTSLEIFRFHVWFPRML